MSYPYQYSYQQPPHYTPTAPQKPKQPVAATLLGMMILGCLGYLLVDRFGGQPVTPGPGPVIDQSQQAEVKPDQQEPDTTPAPAFNPEGTFVVVVSESKARPVEEVSALNQFDFWRRWLPDHGMKWYLLDPQDADATTYLEYAKTQNQEPPFIIHVDKTRLDGDKSPVLWLEMFPPADYDPRKPSLSTYQSRIKQGK